MPQGNVREINRKMDMEMQGERKTVACGVHDEKKPTVQRQH